MRLVVIVAVSFALQLAIHYWPVLETLFGTEPISFRQYVAWIVLGAMPLIVLELGKVLRQKKGRRKEGVGGGLHPTPHTLHPSETGRSLS